MILESIQLFLKKKIVSFGFQLVKKNPNAVKWGIIGLGNMAEVLATTIDGDKDAVVFAVSSRNIDKAKSFASRHGKCLAYGSYFDMLNDYKATVDIIYVATPLKYHYQIVKDCLQAGKNVLCEKPITSSLDQLKDLVALAKEKDCFLMEGMWMKCLPTFRVALDWIKTGKIGTLEFIKVDFYKRLTINPELSIFKIDEGGGVLNDYGVYAIAFMNAFLEGVPEILNFSNRISSLGFDTDWQIQAKKGSREAFVNISSNFSGMSKASVVGDKGSIEWESQFNRTNKISFFDAFGNKIEQYVYKYTYEGFEYEVQEVNQSIKKNKIESEMVPLSETLDVLEVIDTLIKGKRTND